MECLTELRKELVDNYEHSSNGKPPLEQPIFVAACELQNKLAHAVNPETTVSAEDFLAYGKAT